VDGAAPGPDADRCAGGPPDAATATYELELAATSAEMATGGIQLVAGCTLMEECIGQTCDYQIPEGVDVTLTPLSIGGSVFLSWSAGCGTLCDGEVCSFKMPAERFVCLAGFTAP
jgi:hypothetical protein